MNERVSESESLLYAGQAEEAADVFAGTHINTAEEAFALVNALLCAGRGKIAVHSVASLPNEVWASYLRARVMFETEDWPALYEIDADSLYDYGPKVSAMKKTARKLEEESCGSIWYVPQTTTHLPKREGEWRGTSDLRILRWAFSDRYERDRREAAEIAGRLASVSALAADQLPMVRYLFDEERWSEIDTLYMHCIELAPRSFRYYVGRARVLWKIGLDEEAGRMAEWASSQGIRRSELYALNAGNYLKRGNLKQGARNLSKALIRKG